MAIKNNPKPKGRGSKKNWQHKIMPLEKAAKIAGLEKVLRRVSATARKSNAKRIRSGEIVFKIGKKLKRIGVTKYRIIATQAISFF